MSEPVYMSVLGENVERPEWADELTFHASRTYDVEMSFTTTHAVAFMDAVVKTAIRRAAEVIAEAGHGATSAVVVCSTKVEPHEFFDNNPL